MRKLLALALLAPLLAFGQTAIQRNAVTTNVLNSATNGAILLIVSGVPHWGDANLGSITLSNATVLGTLTVSTQLVINGSGSGNLTLYTTNGIQLITISSPQTISSSYTITLPAGNQTNAVLQTTAAGTWYWTADPVLNSVEVNGSGAGYFVLGDASSTNLLTLAAPQTLSQSYTSYFPTALGTVGQVIALGTNGQWYYATVALAGDLVWTNNTAGGNAVLENIDQTKNLAALDYNAGNVLLTTWGDNSPLGFASLTVLIGNTTLSGPNTGGVFIGNNAGVALTNSTSSVAIGDGAGPSDVDDFGNVSIGANSGHNAHGITSFSVFVGYNAHSTLAAATNTIVIGASGEATNDNAVVIGTPASLFHTDTHGTAFPFSTVENVATLTWASTTTLDVSAANANYRTLTLAGDTVFSSTNRAAGHWVTAFITGAATNCAVTFPAWHAMNATLPSSIAAGKVASLTVFFTDGTDTNAIANFAVEQ